MKNKATIPVPRKLLTTTHNKIKSYIPNPNSEGGRRCGIWKKPVRHDYWYWEY